MVRLTPRHELIASSLLWAGPHDSLSSSGEPKEIQAVAGMIPSCVLKRGTVVPLLDLPFDKEGACSSFH